MKVYCVFLQENLEGITTFTLEMIFSTREKADKYIEEHKDYFRSDKFGWLIQEHNVL